jgi:hypothetical protein
MGDSTSQTAVKRYLVIQAVLALAISLGLSLGMLAVDAGGLHTLLGASAQPGMIALFIAGSVVTFWPLVFATGVGLLAAERD